MSDYLGSTPDLADFVRLLSRHGVQYLVVGGHAVGFHSKPRATKDLDIWIESSHENRQRVIDTLLEYDAPPQVGIDLLSSEEDEKRELGFWCPHTTICKHSVLFS